MTSCVTHQWTPSATLWIPATLPSMSRHCSTHRSTPMVTVAAAALCRRVCADKHRAQEASRKETGMVRQCLIFRCTVRYTKQTTHAVTVNKNDTVGDKLSYLYPDLTAKLLRATKLWRSISILTGAAFLDFTSLSASFSLACAVNHLTWCYSSNLYLTHSKWTNRLLITSIRLFPASMQFCFLCIFCWTPVRPSL